ncbi:MAG: RNA polymerase sigma factor [Acidobacteria bacterium]|nr:RNA polymerase sigma factor [Acidobacteriota bacterium]
MQQATWTHSNLQDKILIRQSQKGDQRAFEALMRKYQPQLSSLVCWHAGPAADAEDIVQLILCKVYFSLKKFDLNRPFYPWLRRIAVNRCFDERRRLRRRKAYTFAELELEESTIDTRRPRALPDPYAEDNRTDLGEMLREVLNQLPDEYQEVIVLHHLKQLPYEEIAPILRCTPQAARVKACRARAALRRLLMESCQEIAENFSSSNLMRILDACCRRQPRRVPQVSEMRRDLVLCNS